MSDNCLHLKPFNFHLLHAIFSIFYLIAVCYIFSCTVHQFQSNEPSLRGFCDAHYETKVHSVIVRLDTDNMHYSRLLFKV